MFGGKYFTFSTTETNQPHLRFNMSVTRLVSYSDFVIICDDKKAWYAKNRNENHTTAKIDPDELAWIKLSSTELDSITI